MSNLIKTKLHNRTHQQADTSRSDLNPARCRKCQMDVMFDYTTMF